MSDTKTAEEVAASIDELVEKLTPGEPEFKCLQGYVRLPWTDKTTNKIVAEIKSSGYHKVVIRVKFPPEEEGSDSYSYYDKFLFISSHHPAKFEKDVTRFFTEGAKFSDPEKKKPEEWFGRWGRSIWWDDFVEEDKWLDIGKVCEYTVKERSMLHILTEVADGDVISAVCAYPDRHFDSSPAMAVMLYQRDEKAGERARECEDENPED